jgi:hypothetical protein
MLNKDDKIDDFCIMLIAKRLFFEIINASPCWRSSNKDAMRLYETEGWAQERMSWPLV